MGLLQPTDFYILTALLFCLCVVVSSVCPVHCLASICVTGIIVTAKRWPAFCACPCDDLQGCKFSVRSAFTFNISAATRSYIVQHTHMNRIPKVFLCLGRPS